MMSDDRIEALTQAAETIYKFCDHEKGFYGGVMVSRVTGKAYESWNSFNQSKSVLENKLGRPLTREEMTILSLAIGFGPTPCLSLGMRKEAMETLWARNPETQQPGCFKKMMDVLTSFY